MVSALLNDALSDPKGLINAFQIRHGLDPTAPDYPTLIAAHFRAIFHAHDLVKQIPPLDSHHPPAMYKHHPFTLVRFRAMVQDTSMSPEIYPAVLSGAQPGAWGFAEASSGHHFTNHHVQTLREREVFWAVSVPGESPFVAEYLDDNITLSNTPLEVEHDNCLPHKDPLFRVNHVALQIKIYDPAFPTVKPTQLYTFIGFLALENASEDSDVDTPTLHTIFAEQLPLILPNFIYPFANNDASFIRDKLVTWIANEAFDGDLDAAEWVLLVSMAKVQSRRPPLFPLSLTLSRFPKPHSNHSPPLALTHVLRAVLPLFVDIPLTLDLINHRRFAPESHEESLHAGLLQLPATTTVLISDISMEEGKIEEFGLNNLQALRNAVTTQTLEYRFPFTAPYQFPTDLSFIVLTEGNASPFAETHLNLPMQSSNLQKLYRNCDEICFPPANHLKAFREYIGGALVGDVKVPEELSEFIQSDFVRERQLVSTTSADDLMTWLSLARLVALSHHTPQLSQEIWEKAKCLDKRRRQRLG